MKGWLQIGLLAGAAMLALGTSKKLYGKKLVKPRIASEPGITVKGEPRAWIKEDVNNQGCFAKQRLDFQLAADLRNGTAEPLTVKPATIRLRVDGKVVPIHHAHFYVQSGPMKESKRATTLPAGAEGALWVVADRVLSKKRLKAINRAQLTVPLGRHTLRFVFDQIKQQPVESTR